VTIGAVYLKGAMKNSQVAVLYAGREIVAEVITGSMELLELAWACNFTNIFQNH